MTSQPPAKKSLGQCFLVERGYASQIASALSARPTDTVIEVGPGRGMLTEELLKTGAQVIAVEIDDRLIEGLQKKFGAFPNFVLRHEDFLETDLDRIVPSGSVVKLSGNLPYHLASEVIYKAMAHARRARHDPALPWVETSVLMLQKEVAERVAAKPGSKAWGKLSVFAQIEADVNYMFTVPAAAFKPTPKVDGGVIRLDYLKLPPYYPKDYQIFERMVRYCFHQRRKMLKSTLGSLAGVHPFWQASDLEFTRRPETLTPAEWVSLTDVVVRGRDKSED